MDMWNALDVVEVVNNGGGHHSVYAKGRVDKGWYFGEAFKCLALAASLELEERKAKKEQA